MTQGGQAFDGYGYVPGPGYSGRDLEDACNLNAKALRPPSTRPLPVSGSGAKTKQPRKKRNKVQRLQLAMAIQPVGAAHENALPGQAGANPM